jgi:dolichyl-phosphate-mannose--protein O-mannosyl transferase
VMMWNYDWWSSFAQWHWPPYKLGIYHSEAPWVSPVADGSLVSSVLGGIPELARGVGDLLVTDANARLPFGAHRTNPINHAEAFWDPNLQQQVLGALNGIRLGGQPLYGQVVKLSHPLTGQTLHSHALNYGHAGTSGQQQVTAFAGYDDNDLWRIKGPHGQAATFKQGQPVQHGDIIRLEHVLTQRNLHSHGGIPSPVTRQQEVTCFGSWGNGDSNDNWRVEIAGGGAVGLGRRMRLIHVNTNHALHSHAGWSHPQWTANQQEVTGFGGRDDNDWWAVFETR